MWLTNEYKTPDAAEEEFRNLYDIVYDTAALPLFISEYGPKDVYSIEEIQNLLDKYKKESQLVSQKTLRK